MKTLTPVRETLSDYEDIEEYLKQFLYKEFYLPILKALSLPKSTVVKNSTSDLIDAIRSGRIHFSRGQFTGRFNSAVSRELKRLGAKWDRKQGSWKIPLSNLPLGIANEIRVSFDRFQLLAQKLDKQLSDFVPDEIAEKINLNKLIDSTLFRVEEKLRQTITIEPKFSKDQQVKIADDYTNNMRLDIKNWTDAEIKKLRKQVQERVTMGFRYETMIKDIQRSYEVGKNKAKFLARQETSLLVTKFKELRYKDAGVNKYKWACVVGSPNHPVRPMHKALEGKIFSWDNPPVTSDDGRRNNPGQDFGCRCFAIPVVEF